MSTPTPQEFLAQQLATASEAERALFDIEAHITTPARVTSHLPRERVYDDRQQKIVAGRLWLISFTDLFSIMLCMFLLIYSMKDPDMEKISKMVGVQGGGGLHSGAGAGDKSSYYKAPEIGRASYGDGINLDYLQGVLNNVMVQAKLADVVHVVPAGDHLNLVVADARLFAQGSVLSESGQLILKDLAPRLQLLSNRIAVIGLSGDWGESLRQAGSVADVLHDSGYRKPFAVLGTAADSGDSVQIRVEADDGRLH